MHSNLDLTRNPHECQGSITALHYWSLVLWSKISLFFLGGGYDNVNIRFLAKVHQVQMPCQETNAKYQAMQQLHLGIPSLWLDIFFVFIWRKPQELHETKKHKNHWRNNLTRRPIFVQEFVCFSHSSSIFTARTIGPFESRNCLCKNVNWNSPISATLGIALEHDESFFVIWVESRCGYIRDQFPMWEVDIEAKSQCIGSLGLKLLGKSGDLGEVPYPKTAWGNALRMFWRFLRTGFISGAITSWFYSVLSSRLGGLVTKYPPGN